MEKRLSSNYIMAIIGNELGGKAIHADIEDAHSIGRSDYIRIRLASGVMVEGKIAHKSRKFTGKIGDKAYNYKKLNAALPRANRSRGWTGFKKL